MLDLYFKNIQLEIYKEYSKYLSLNIMTRFVEIHHAFNMATLSFDHYQRLKFYVTKLKINYTYHYSVNSNDLN